MKNIGLKFVFIAMVMLCTSCASLIEFVDYGIEEWERIAPAGSYDRTYIDAWQSGTGGKILAVSGIATDLFGDPNKETTQTAKNIIAGALQEYNSNDVYKQNDVNSWFGTLFTTGTSMYSQYNKNRIQEIYNENSDFIDSVNWEKGIIYWKSSSDQIRVLKELREQELAEEFESRSIDITTDEYFDLPADKRHQIDLILLEDVPEVISPEIPEENPETNVVDGGEKEVVSPYIALIENSFIGSYTFNEIALTEDQEKELDNVAEYLLSDSSLCIEIIGHTCTIGTEKANYNVGLQRAVNVENYLIDKGIDANRISVNSESYHSPQASNDTLEGRAKNRRVTFKVIVK